ncbi:MAG: hypothetical protein SV775_03560 [Thermodesulfobacteriota bacterium]|nr:hypothetical protein [Thermodesulfobacteriota bacterium]
MEKIVITTDHVDENYQLIASLRQLFPECEIEILPRQTNNPEQFCSDLEYSNRDWRQY